MNFRPPDRWLQRPSNAAALAPAVVQAAQPTHLTGRVAPLREATAAWVGGRLLPGPPVRVRRAHLGAGRHRVTLSVGDFTGDAMALCQLRFTAASQLGRLLPTQREAADMLDVNDPSAVHIVARCDGELVGAVRLSLPLPGADHAWQGQVEGARARHLSGLTPAVELSRLTLAADVAAAPLWRGLVQAAAYVATQQGRRYAFVAAAPDELAAWQRFGLRRTGLGGYVPSARPHVVEICVADLWAAFYGHHVGARAWCNLFSHTHDAVAAVLQHGQAPAANRRAALYRTLGRVLAKVQQVR